MRLYIILPSVLFIQVYVDAAPSQSDVSQLEQIAKVETADIKLDEPITLEQATSSYTNNDSRTQNRHKRFYNYFGYGFPPVNPVIYQNYPNNDPYQNNFGEDQYQHIHRQLQDIASVIRNPNFNQPPPPPPFPVYFPVIFVPLSGCRCTPKQGKPTQNSTDDIDISNRFPEMEDTRQNWGFVVNKNETEEDDGMEEDFTRPISFEPIQPNKTMSRPPPAVEHGSDQGGLDSMTTTTTAVPTPAAAPPASSSSFNVPTQPSACDAAVLSCCHQAQVTYDCFVVQGCPDPTSYGNPCETQVILQVIDRFQRFYGQRNG